LVAHAWGNTFALGAAWNALKLVADMPADIVLPTAFLAAAFLWLLNFMGGIIVCWLYGKWEGIKEGLPAVIAISFVHGAVQMATIPISTDNNTLFAAIAAFILVPILAKTKWYNKPSNVKSNLMQEGIDKIEVAATSEENRLSMVQASVPYIALMIMMFGITVFKPLKAFLAQWTVGFALPETTTGLGIVNAAETAYKAFAPLTHAGTLLFISGFIGYWYLSSRRVYEPGAFGRILRNTLAKTMPSVIGVTALVAMSQVMNGTGQASVLAFGAAQATGPVYPFISPFIGVLGAFLTSSNMASNILFGNFQNLTAEVLALDKVVILASQTAGGAIGNTIAPGNVLLGTTTAGILGKEGECLKTTIVVAIFCAAVTGIVAMFLA
jgi:lactate permease